MTVVINHIALHVCDLSRSTEFYGQVLGLPQLDEPFKMGMHSWFALGPHCNLHLIGGCAQSPELHINHHIAFATTDFDGFVSKLVAANVSYYDAFKNKDVLHTRPDGIRQVFFQDPDGYWLEMNNHCSNEL